MSSLQYDAVIIGGGVIGSAVARELSRYKMKVCLVEKGEDVCSGTSKANSAIIHAGYDAETGTLKARMNVEGNRMMGKLAEELDFSFQRNGSLVLCFSEEDRPALNALYERGVANGVPDLRIISGDEVRAMEPNISDDVVAALDAPTGGIVCPFGLTIALAENACDNGVEFRMLTEVAGIEKLEEGYRLLIAGKEPITTRYVVNAAGVYSDVFHNMVSRKKIRIIPRKGDYCLLDKEAGSHVSRTVFQLPGKYGKGILVSPTIHGNLLLGPTASDIEEKDGTYTTAEELADVLQKSALSVKGIPYRQVITSFSGIRAHEAGGEFILGEAEDAKGFYDAAGIESPGLSSAPAIGVYLAEMIAKAAGAGKKEDFIAVRKGIPHVAEMEKEERKALIKERPDYGIIVCRCENVSEGEIVDAIHRTLGARSLDGIKRRVRQGMGRCQAGFCTPRTMEILSRETGIPMEKICKNQPGSEMIIGDGGAEENGSAGEA
ncbi:MAG: NAD(P)/FAD-dependent oxidoreductase [Lachnospiraceae bacterium]|nr:NAD(P)/FAD-dependent oxidoreductase [Lachnospiraceae bacterium]